jgi:dolichol kinase
MIELVEFLRVYWFQIAQIIISLIIGGNLAQQFSLQKQKSLAGKLARFTLSLIFSAAYYVLFFYLTSIFWR